MTHNLHALGACCAGMARGTFDLTNSRDNYPPDAPVLPQHVFLDVAVDLQARTLTGTATWKVLFVRAGAEVSFDAKEMAIESVLDGTEPAQFRVEGGKVHVQLKSPAQPRTERTIVLRYRVEKPRLGLYFVGPDAEYPDKPLQAWTQGQDDDAPYWFPCFDQPNLKFTTEVRCTVPKGYRALSNGPLVEGPTEAGDQSVWRHRHDVPQPAYLVTLVVAQLAEITERHGGLPVRFFVTPGREEEARRSFGKTPQMVRFFEERLGVPYAYAEYNQVAVADFVFGGMENTGMTTQTDRTLHDARAHLDFSSDELVAHELAHQWFGNLVTCRTWSEAWLNEGFATYFASLWMEHDLRRDEFLYELWLHARRYFEEDGRRYRRPVVTRRYQEPVDLFDRHLYEKGARILHMLRVDLGDEAFFGGLRRYLQRHARGGATTDDLCRALEEESGRSLERFFDDWVHSGGHPELTVEYSFDAEQKIAWLTVQQGSKPQAGRAWSFPLVVRVHAGADVVTVTLKVDQDTQRFPIAVSARPTRVVVDPDDTVLKTLKLKLPEELLINQLKDDGSSLARIRAAFALQDVPTRAAQDALAHVLVGEAFWGVQADCATALGEMRGERPLQLLVDALPKVKHPKARRGVVRALGNWKRPEAAAALEKVVVDGDESYFVEAEAATALGKTQDARAVGVLAGVLADRPSWLDVVRAGCASGLGETRSAAAIDVVKPWLAYGRPIAVRLAAMNAIAKLAEGRPQASDVATELERFADETDFRVRMGLLGAAETLMEPGTLGFVERLMRQGPDGRIKRRAEEVARALKAGRQGKEQLEKLREEHDKLKEEHRTLRDRVQALEAARGGSKT